MANHRTNRSPQDGNAPTGKLARRVEAGEEAVCYAPCLTEGTPYPDFSIRFRCRRISGCYPVAAPSPNRWPTARLPAVQPAALPSTIRRRIRSTCFADCGSLTAEFLGFKFGAQHTGLCCFRRVIRSETSGFVLTVAFAGPVLLVEVRAPRRIRFRSDQRNGVPDSIEAKENPLALASGHSRDDRGYPQKLSIRLGENRVRRSRGPLLVLPRVRRNQSQTEVKVLLFKLPFAQSHPMLPREASDCNLRFQVQDGRDDDPADVVFLDQLRQVFQRAEHLVAIHAPQM